MPSELCRDLFIQISNKIVFITVLYCTLINRNWHTFRCGIRVICISFLDSTPHWCGKRWLFNHILVSNIPSGAQTHRFENILNVLIIFTILRTTHDVERSCIALHFVLKIRDYWLQDYFKTFFRIWNFVFNLCIAVLHQREGARAAIIHSLLKKIPKRGTPLKPCPNPPPHRWCS